MSKNSQLYAEIDKFEVIVKEFIEKELEISSLGKKIIHAINEIDELLKKTKSLRLQSKFSLFLPGDFIENDNELRRINLLFFSIYDEKNGLLKLIWDHLLSCSDHKKFLYLFREKDLLTRELSIEKELLIKGILFKNYLTNINQLLLPFYQIKNNNIFTDLKNQLIEEIEERIIKLKQAKQKEDSPIDNLAVIKNYELNISNIKKIDKTGNEKLDQGITVNEDRKKITNYKIPVNEKFSIDNEKMYCFAYLLDCEATNKYSKNSKKSSLFLSFTEKLFILNEKIVKLQEKIFNSKKPGFFLTRVSENSRAYENNLKILLNNELIIDSSKQNLTALNQEITDLYVKNFLTWLEKNSLEIEFLNRDRSICNIYFQKKEDSQKISQQIKEIENNLGEEITTIFVLYEMRIDRKTTANFIVKRNRNFTDQLRKEKIFFQNKLQIAEEENSKQAKVPGSGKIPLEEKSLEKLACNSSDSTGQIEIFSNKLSSNFQKRLDWQKQFEILNQNLSQKIQDLEIEKEDLLRQNTFINRENLRMNDQAKLYSERYEKMLALYNRKERRLLSPEEREN